MRDNGVKKLYLLIPVFAMMFMFMLVGVASAAPAAVPVISSTSHISTTVPPASITVTLTGDTFTTGAAIVTNWTFNYGTTAVTASSITVAGTQATIDFNGTPQEGTITVKANKEALTGGVASNSINIISGVSIVIVPSDDATGIPVNQIITLTTGVTCNTDKTKITLKDDTGTSVNTSISTNNTTITIVPTAMLNYGKNYILTVQAGALVDSSLNTNKNAQKDYSFTTAYNFSALIKDATAFNNIISHNPPRKLNVTVPKKYMTGFVITYASNLDTPLTNVDITAEAEVNSIRVTFGTNAPVDAVKTGDIWNAGYSGSMLTADPTIGQDITLIAYDQYSRQLEKRIIKLNPKGSTKLDLSSTKSLSGMKTLSDLIANNGKIFTDIFKQFDIGELTLSTAN